jgi:hypothetical protein
MGIVIYGVQEVHLGIDEFLVKCSVCETATWSDVMITSQYYHLYYIPMFPIEMQANIICQRCGDKRYGRSFDQNLISNYYEVKGKYRHPWYTYIGVAFITIVFLMILLSSVL